MYKTSDRHCRHLELIANPSHCNFPNSKLLQLSVCQRPSNFSQHFAGNSWKHAIHFYMFNLIFLKFIKDTIDQLYSVMTNASHKKMLIKNVYKCQLQKVYNFNVKFRVHITGKGYLLWPTCVLAFSSSHRWQQLKTQAEGVHVVHTNESKCFCISDNSVNHWNAKTFSLAFAFYSSVPCCLYQINLGTNYPVLTFGFQFEFLWIWHHCQLQG